VFCSKRQKLPTGTIHLAVQLFNSYQTCCKHIYYKTCLSTSKFPPLFFKSLRKHYQAREGKLRDMLACISIFTPSVHTTYDHLTSTGFPIVNGFRIFIVHCMVWNKTPSSLKRDSLFFLLSAQ